MLEIIYDIRDKPLMLRSVIKLRRLYSSLDKTIALHQRKCTSYVQFLRAQSTLTTCNLLGIYTAGTPTVEGWRLSCTNLVVDSPINRTDTRSTYSEYSVVYTLSALNLQCMYTIQGDPENMKLGDFLNC